MIGVDVRMRRGGFSLDVRAEIPGPAVVGVAGPNGAGKSTLLHAMAGVQESGGSVTYNGAELRRMPRRERVRAVAYVEQHHGTPPDITVGQLAAMGASAGQGAFWRATAGAPAVDAALGATGLTCLRGRSLRTLSGGQLQRAMIARALAQDSEHVLLDEPTNHLDLRHQHELMLLLREVMRRRGSTVVTAVHDLGLAAAYCDLLLVLDGGRAAAFGPPRDVLTPDLLRGVFGVDGAFEEVAGAPTLVVHGPLPRARDGEAGGSGWIK